MKELNFVNQTDLKLESHLYPLFDVTFGMLIILSELVFLGTKLA